MDDITGQKHFKKLFFCHQKSNKNSDSAWNFLQTPITVCRCAYILYFKINVLISCCPLFSENYLNPQASINKMVKKHSEKNHPSPSRLILRIQGVYLSRIFLEFFPKPVYSTMVVVCSAATKRTFLPSDFSTIKAL